MKRLASLLIVLSLMICPLAMGWESAVHAKGVQDICKALGFNEKQATRVGDGAWHDGNDIRIERKKGEKKVDFYRNQDRAFNTGVLAEGTPVKTYGKIAVSPNDTRYLNSKKYLNKAIRLAKEGKTQEAFYALGTGVRALQNIFANRDVVNDEMWLTQAKMNNGAASWIPGATFDTAWHNVNPSDDVFSKDHADALKAALEATADYVGEFLAACPQAVENVKPLPDSAIDGIVAETLSLIPLKEELTQQVKKTSHDIMTQLDKPLPAFPVAATIREQESLPPHALTAVPANWLTTLAKVAFRRQLEDLKSDVEDFSGSANAEWNAFTKTVDDSLEQLRKSADDISKALTDAAAALKKSSQEDGYSVARKQLVELSNAVFASLKPYYKSEKLFDEQLAYWVDVLNEQMGENAVRHGFLLWKIYYALKTQLPKTDAAFADFINASNAAVKEYTDRCENALADFEQEMATIADAYGKDAAALKTSAAECVSNVRKAFDEKAKQAEESLKGIAPLKQGEAIPKAVDDVIRGLMNDAKDLKDNVLKNIAPGVPNNRQAECNPLKLRSFLAANVIHQDFLRPIDIGSRHPDSWKSAVWKNDDLLEITMVRRPSAEAYETFFEIVNDGKKIKDEGDKLGKEKGYYDRISDNGFTTDVAHDLMGDVGGEVAGSLAGNLFEKGGGLLGRVIGSRFGPVGEAIGTGAGTFLGAVAGSFVGDWVGEHLTDGIDYFFGKGTADNLAHNIVDGIDFINDKWDDLNDYLPDFLKFGQDEFDPSKYTQEQKDEFLNEMDKIMDIFHDTFNLNDPLQRPIAISWLDAALSGITEFISGMMDTISSFTLQIRGAMMGLMNLIVNIEHVDVSAEMDESLRVLTRDLNVMSGKDDEQDKSVVRKATIENKGRDLRRQSSPKGELKGTPAVQQVQMGGDDGGRRKGIGIEGGERVSPRSGGRDNVGRDRIGPSGKPGIYEHANP